MFASSSLKICCLVRAEAAQHARQAKSPVGSLLTRTLASTLNATMPLAAPDKQEAVEQVAAPLAMRSSSNMLQPSSQLQAHGPSAHSDATPPQHLPEQATGEGNSCRHTGSVEGRHTRKRRDACTASAAPEADPSQTKHVKRHCQGLAVVLPGPDAHHTNEASGAMLPLLVACLLCAYSVIVYSCNTSN